MLQASAMPRTLLLTLIALSISVATPGTNALEHLQIADWGDAMSAVLDEKGDLAAHDDALMQSTIDSLLPPNTGFRIELNCNSGISVSAGSALPDKRFIASGVRYLTIASNAAQDDPCSARWWTWLQ